MAVKICEVKRKICAKGFDTKIEIKTKKKNTCRIGSNKLKFHSIFQNQKDIKADLQLKPVQLQSAKKLGNFETRGHHNFLVLVQKTKIFFVYF